MTKPHARYAIATMKHTTLQKYYRRQLPSCRNAGNVTEILPKGIVSDRDSKFTGDFWVTIQKMLGTDLLMSTRVHPQTDGQSERTNRTLLQILRNFVNRNGSNWAKFIGTVEFAINSAVNSSTDKAPFEIIYGYLPRTIPRFSTTIIIRQRWTSSRQGC
jgi:transposase InsO family protein